MDGFRFLDLPPEVRNQIYVLLLTAQYCPGKRGSSGRRSQLGLTAGIVGVSRKLRSESEAFLYSLNTFQAHPKLLARLPFLTEISRPILSPLNAARIRRFYIEVRLDNGPFWGGEELQKAFSGIHELHVVSWQASYGTCGMENLLPFAQVRRVGRARVEGSNVSPSFARWLEGVMESDEGDEVSMDELLELPDYDPWEQGNR